MVDDLIREMTEPETRAPADAKPAARGRLLDVARAEGRRLPRHPRRLGRQGLAVLLALIVVPTGVAVATELGRDQTLKPPSDCPEFLAGLQERGLSTEGMVLYECPVGAEVDQLLDQMTLLQERRREMEGNGEPVDLGTVVGFGRSDDGKPWGIVGIAGEARTEADR